MNGLLLFAYYWGTTCNSLMVLMISFINLMDLPCDWSQVIIHLILQFIVVVETHLADLSLFPMLWVDANQLMAFKKREVGIIIGNVGLLLDEVSLVIFNQYLLYFVCELGIINLCLNLWANLS